MEEGSFRCDCNVSVRKRGATEYGVRTEIKNLNSFRYVEDAIEYETARQIEMIEAGKRIPQETLLWDPIRKETRPMRSKEYANDYRYFPEPDLPPLLVSAEMVEQVRASMPELPADRRARYVREGLTDYEAGVLTADREVADYFEAVLPGLENRKSAANWVMTEVLRVARDSDKSFADAAPPTREVGALLRMIEEEKISLNAAKTAFAAMVKSGNSAAKTIAELGLAQVSDEGAIAAACDAVLAAEPGKVEEYRAGRNKLFGFFVGAVMKAMGGKASPKVINDILRKKLAG
jgi:aspartyl-tRNA(Asn)/glutamyl-tRNA(Gln) amidotransferase subunit B